MWTICRSVEVEIKQNIRRLQSHASIAVWAGNNENEAALRQNWYSDMRGLNFGRIIITLLGMARQRNILDLLMSICNYTMV